MTTYRDYAALDDKLADLVIELGSVDKLSAALESKDFDGGCQYYINGEPRFYVVDETGDAFEGISK